MKYKPQKTNVPIDKKITIEKGELGMSSSMLRSFKAEYGVRMKMISENKENIEVYTTRIQDNMGNLLGLHEVLEELFVEFIDITEVFVWQNKVNLGSTSIEILKKRFLLMAEYGFPNNRYIKK